MTFADALRSAGAGVHLLDLWAMLDHRARDTTVAPSWPDGLECDTVAAPLDACCGVFDQLSRLDGRVPPIAQLGEVLLFLVRPGSAATALASLSADCEALGIEIRDGTSRHAGTTGAVPTTGSWVVPPSDDNGELPPASTVVTAIRAAYAATRQREREGEQ
jgi:hypothetical protein